MNDAEIGKIAAQTARQETIDLLRKDKRTSPTAFVDSLGKSLKNRFDRSKALKLLAEIYELTSNTTKVELPEKMNITFTTDFGAEK